MTSRDDNATAASATAASANTTAEAAPPRPDAGAGTPAAGSAVTLVPALDARLLTGALLRWDAPDGAAVDANITMVVDVSPTRARGGEFPVWATVSVPGGDTLVLSARAHPGEE